MAAPELTVWPRWRAVARSGACGISAAWLYAYATLWTCTLATAGAVAVLGRPLSSATRQLLGLTLTPSQTAPPHLSHVLALAAHNIPIAAWPLLLGVAGVGRHRLAVRAADGVLVACMLANTVPVGAAIGAYGSAVIAYVPQLPAEWAGLAIGYGSWLVERRRPVGSRERLQWLTLIAATLLLAAGLETVTVPHR